MNDLYDELRELRLPLLLYGMGDGADKLLSVLERKGLRVSGVFCSDGFVRGKTFRGMPVTSYADARRAFGTFAVLVAFGSARDEVLGNIDAIARETVLRVPDLPVAGETLFDGAFYEAHKDGFAAARALFEDERSREVFDTVLAAKLTGRPEYFMRAASTPEEDFRTLLHPGSYRRAADLGAYDGDSARFLLRLCPRLEEITAFEPDEKTFSRLKRKTEGLPVVCLPYAAWDREETLGFARGGSRGSGISAGGKEKTVTEVSGVPGDRIFINKRVDFIKFDVEGAEKRALSGLKETVARDKPEMLISCYHRPEDLFELPLYIKERHPYYRLYLRRQKGVPAWDIGLYCTPVCG
ncbi:MAG: FkbM family methyltransferase [Clostridia bacterium]|nr:FkbM family methyltransferase [Clostridia bacterium]